MPEAIADAGVDVHLLIVSLKLVVESVDLPEQRPWHALVEQPIVFEIQRRVVLRHEAVGGRAVVVRAEVDLRKSRFALQARRQLRMLIVSSVPLDPLMPSSTPSIPRRHAEPLRRRVPQRVVAKDFAVRQIEHRRRPVLTRHRLRHGARQFVDRRSAQCQLPDTA